MKVIGVSVTLCTILTLSRAAPLNSTLQTSSCESEKQKCNRTLLGAFCPQCDSNGNYLPEQCFNSTGYCWCVNVTDGTMLPNTTTPPGQQLTCGLCHIEQQNCSKGLPGAFCPRCDSNGNFLPEQCYGSTGYCWCVDVISGKTLPNTTMPPGHQPNCGGGWNQPNPPPEPTPCVNCDNATDHKEEPNHNGEPDEESDGSEEDKDPKEPEPECDDCSNASKSSEEEDESTEPDPECDGCSSESDEHHHDCPHGWSRFRDHCYMFISSPKTWVDAEVYCQFDGANLASVHSDHGNHFIMSLTRGNTHDFPQSWLGGFDAIHPGYWMWSDGSDFDYNNWAENVHDDKKKNCLRMNYEYDLKWFPTSCTDPLPFVCARSVSAPPDAPGKQE